MFRRWRLTGPATGQPVSRGEPGTVYLSGNEPILADDSRRAGSCFGIWIDPCHDTAYEADGWAAQDRGFPGPETLRQRRHIPAEIST